MNAVIEKWRNSDIEFAGLIHSHPNVNIRPSVADEKYANDLMIANKCLKNVLFPIVTIKNGNIIIYYYEFTKNFTEVEVIIKWRSNNINNG